MGFSFQDEPKIFWIPLGTNISHEEVGNECKDKKNIKYNVKSVFT